MAGGKQTTPLACETHTPPVTTGAFDNVAINAVLPQNWTHYQIRLNSTTDPGFTPGVWYDVTSPNGLPQPTTCSFGGPCNVGLFITKMVPANTSTIATAN